MKLSEQLYGSASAAAGADGFGFVEHFAAESKVLERDVC